MKLAGYREVFTRSYDWHGQRAPAHQRMFLRIAPHERPDAIVSFANQSGHDTYQTAASITDVQVASNGAVFFGVGIPGMMGASLASMVDRALAGWDIYLSGPAGHIHLYSQWGPPPGVEELGEVEMRLRRSRAVEDPWQDTPEVEFRDQLDAHEDSVASAAVASEGAHGTGADVIVGDGTTSDDDAFEDEFVRDLPDEDASSLLGTDENGNSSATGVVRVAVDVMNIRLAGHPLPSEEKDVLDIVMSNLADEDELAELLESMEDEVYRTRAYLMWVEATGFYEFDDDAQAYLTQLLAALVAYE